MNTATDNFSSYPTEPEARSNTIGQDKNGRQNLHHSFLVVLLAVIISLLHYFPLQGWWGTHLLHRELYFFPILLAAFWFGIKGGIVTAAGVSAIYILQFVVSGRLADVLTAVGFQTVVFFSVGLLLGWMVDRQNSRRLERDKIKEAFGRYVPSEVRDEILRDGISIEGEFRHVTVLFADLRNFTEMIETNGPRTGVMLINRYFEEMTHAITCNGGLVLQFIGDEIEAVFGAPLPKGNHADLAVQAAMDMRSRLAALNRELAKRNLPTLNHGIGIHTGQVLAGNIGSPERSTYALVGETVNLASRIQELNKRFGSDVLVSEATATAVGNRFRLSGMRPVKVKGFRDAVATYRIDPHQMLYRPEDREDRDGVVIGD